MSGETLSTRLYVCCGLWSLETLSHSTIVPYSGSHFSPSQSAIMGINGLSCLITAIGTLFIEFSKGRNENLIQEKSPNEVLREKAVSPLIQSILEQSKRGEWWSMQNYDRANTALSSVIVATCVTFTRHWGGLWLPRIYNPVIIKMLCVP